MTRKELLELIAGGESSTVEFKRKITKPEKIAKEIIAFANTKGGYLIIGVDDDCKIYGVDSEKYETEEIINSCHNYIDPPIEPEIEITNLKGKYVVVCYIQESNNKPHQLINHEETGQAYIRIGEKSVPASKEMTKLLAGLNRDAKPVTIFIGDRERRFFSFLEKYEKGTVSDFASLTNISKRRARQIIVKLVRAGVLQIHNDDSSDYFTLV